MKTISANDFDYQTVNEVLKKIKPSDLITSYRDSRQHNVTFRLKDFEVEIKVNKRQKPVIVFTEERTNKRR